MSRLPLAPSGKLRNGLPVVQTFDQTKWRMVLVDRQQLCGARLIGSEAEAKAIHASTRN